MEGDLQVHPPVSAVLTTGDVPPSIVEATVMRIGVGACFVHLAEPLPDGTSAMLSIRHGNEFVSRPVQVGSDDDGLVSLLFTPTPRLDSRWESLSASGPRP